MTTLYRRRALVSFLLNAHKVAVMLVGIPLFLGAWYVGTHQRLFETHGWLLKILFPVGLILFVPFQLAWEIMRWRFNRMRRTFKARTWYVVQFSDLWRKEDLLLRGSELRQLRHQEDVVFVEEHDPAQPNHREAQERRLADAWGTTPLTRRVVREIKALQRLGEENE